MVTLNKRVPSKGKGEIPRSMRPIIPEPKHRVAPKGVSSGISFRNLPSPSLDTIKKICEHYESKCSGQYNSLASRYVLQMGKEIRSQIQAIQSMNRPQHFTFDDSILDDLDFAILPNETKDNKAQGRSYNRGVQQNEYEQMNSSSSSSFLPSSSRLHNHLNSSNEQSLKRQIRKLEDIISEKKAELELQQEKAIKDLKECEQQHREKNQVERLHYENSQRLLKHSHNEELKKFKREIAQVKSDARLIIDFVRRKANEAIAEESTKMAHQKRSIGKKMDAIESLMKKSFHNHMHSLEEEVKMAVRKEKKAINLTVLPPPPPKNISIMPKKKLDHITVGNIKHEVRSIPSDYIGTPDISTNDSMSTRFSESSYIASREERCISSEHQLLKSRVKELDQWTDALTLALSSGAKIKSPPDTRKSNLSSCASSAPPPSRSSCNLDM